MRPDVHALGQRVCGRPEWGQRAPAVLARTARKPAHRQAGRPPLAASRRTATAAGWALSPRRAKGRRPQTRAAPRSRSSSQPPPPLPSQTAPLRFGVPDRLPRPRSPSHRIVNRLRRCAG
ncbi:hypothetical protein ACFPRL_10955 [Pseudoclavibacter helvolus]